MASCVLKLNLLKLKVCYKIVFFFGNWYVQGGWFASQYWQDNVISESTFADVKKLNGNRNRLALVRIVPGSGS